MEWAAADDPEEMPFEATATAAAKTTVVPPVTVVVMEGTTNLESILT